MAPKAASPKVSTEVSSCCWRASGSHRLSKIYIICCWREWTGCGRIVVRGVRVQQLFSRLTTCSRHSSQSTGNEPCSNVCVLRVCQARFDRGRGGCSSDLTPQFVESWTGTPHLIPPVLAVLLQKKPVEKNVAPKKAASTKKAAPAKKVRVSGLQFLSPFEK